MPDPGEKDNPMSKTVRSPRHWRHNRHRARQPTFRSRPGRNSFDPCRRGDRTNANANGTRSCGVRRTGSRRADGRLPRAFALRRFQRRCDRRKPVSRRGGCNRVRRRARALLDDVVKRLRSAPACWLDRPAPEGVTAYRIGSPCQRRSRSASALLFLAAKVLVARPDADTAGALEPSRFGRRFFHSNAHRSSAFVSSPLIMSTVQRQEPTNSSGFDVLQT